MDTDNNQQEMQEIWKKFNKQGKGTGGVKPVPSLTPEEDKRRNRKQIGMYILITFVLTYGTEIFGIMPMAGNMDAEQAYRVQSMISSVMFLPAVGALLTLLLTKERLTVKSLMLTINLKKDLKYYGLAWVGFVLMILFGSALYFLIFHDQFDAGLGYMKTLMAAQGVEATEEQLRQTVMMQLGMGAILAPFANLLNCFGEEWGWRGFLLPGC